VKTGTALLTAAAVVFVPLSGTAVLGAVALTTAVIGPCGPAGTPHRITGVSLDAEQLANAETIVTVTRRYGLPPRAAVIAVATAMQESTLRNLDHGDAAGPDSRGLFQQRTSIYGAAVATDPTASTLAFLALLVKVPDWQTIPLTVAAATVQRPRADLRDRYARWESLADAIVMSDWPGADLSAAWSTTLVTPGTAATAGTGTSPTALPDANTLADQLRASSCGSGGDALAGDGQIVLPAGYQLPTAGQAATAIRYALTQLGKPYVWGGDGSNNDRGGYDCSGLTMKSWAAAGVAIPRTADQQSRSGIPVASLSEMQPGDLLFIPGTDGSASHPGHVGMYIGNVNGVPFLVQAPHTGTVIHVNPVADWSGHIVAIRRPVDNTP